MIPLNDTYQNALILDYDIQFNVALNTDATSANDDVDALVGYNTVWFSWTSGPTDRLAYFDAYGAVEDVPPGAQFTVNIALIRSEGDVPYSGNLIPQVDVRQYVVEPDTKYFIVVGSAVQDTTGTIVLEYRSMSPASTPASNKLVLVF